MNRDHLAVVIAMLKLVIDDRFDLDLFDGRGKIDNISIPRSTTYSSVSNDLITEYVRSKRRRRLRVNTLLLPGVLPVFSSEATISTRSPEMA